MSSNTPQERTNVEAADFQLVEEDIAHFFAPTTADALDPLLGAYQHQRGCIEAVAEFMGGPSHAAALQFFVDGNADQERGRLSLTNAAGQLFHVPGAIGQLNATYWSKALALTDVLNLMPQKRRNEWDEQIRNPLGKKVHRDTDTWEVEPLPDFTPDTVRSTIRGLLTMRSKFFAERVDGIFRALSHKHVTNAPEGFTRRMIVAGALDEYGHCQHRQSGTINDLRCVIAKFMGRDEPGYMATDMVLRDALRFHRGEWVSLDGGSLRLRVYKVGTAHLEVHPDMAYRLNQVLAHLHPAAIPAQFRTKPKTKPKSWVMTDKPLPFAVVELLARMKVGRVPVGESWRQQYESVPMTLAFDYSSRAKQELREAESVLRAIGGTPVRGYWQFDYEPGKVVSQIVASGCIPDQQAHQYFATPERLAHIAIELADIGESDSVGELSAGQGAIADLLPKGRTTCVEISPLHCQILRAKGHDVIEDDFLTWADVTNQRFDRIVINPPYSEGRWRAHSLASASLLLPGGRLVAILPAIAKGQEFIPGCSHEWSSVYNNEFVGTGISVVMLTAIRQPA